VAGIVDSGLGRSIEVDDFGTYRLSLRLATGQPCLRLVLSAATEIRLAWLCGAGGWRRVTAPFPDTLRVDVVLPAR